MSKMSMKDFMQEHGEAAHKLIDDLGRDPVATRIRAEELILALTTIMVSSSEGDEAKLDEGLLALHGMIESLAHVMFKVINRRIDELLQTEGNC